MKNSLIKCLVVAGLAFAPSLATADSSPYLRIDIGGSFPTKFKAVEYGNKKPNNHFMFGLGAGYKIEENLRLDINYTRAHNIKFAHEINIGNVPFAVSQKLHSNVGMINASFDIGNYAGFTPYITAGAGYAQNVTKDHVVVNNNLNLKIIHKGHKRNNFAWNIGAGASFQLVENTHLDVGYKFYHFGKASTSSSKVVNGGAAVTTTPISTRLSAHAVTIGLRYIF